MFEPTEFIGGPREGQSIAHAEMPGKMIFENGHYALMIERLSDEEFLNPKTPQKQWYQWHPISQ